MYVANITNILNERVCALQTILLFSIEKNMHHQHYQDFKMKKNAWHKHNVLNEKKMHVANIMNANMKLHVPDRTSF